LNLDQLRDRLRAFADERDWNRFHSPKNLAMALSVEVAELVEHFQWLAEEESKRLPPDVRAEVAEEIADVQIYLVRLADRLGIDILEAAEAKVRANAAKYPADRVRGSSKKYDRYDGGGSRG
jgi:dCTP diphosphatase